MNTPKFVTYWEVNDQRIDCQKEVERLVVEQGKVAREVSPDMQRAAHEREQLLKAWHQKSIERYQKACEEQAHRNSPEGQRQAAVQNALQNPGGIVSGGMDGIAELDAYGPTKL